MWQPAFKCGNFRLKARACLLNAWLHKWTSREVARAIILENPVVHGTRDIFGLRVAAILFRNAVQHIACIHLPIAKNEALDVGNALCCCFIDDSRTCDRKGISDCSEMIKSWHY